MSPPKLSEQKKIKRKRKSEKKIEPAHNQPPKQPPPIRLPDDPAPVPGFNLAGRPDNLFRTTGLKRLQAKAQGPFHSSNITNDSYLHFVVRANKHEWIRFKPDSLSLVLYGKYKNKNRSDAVSASEESKAEKHSLRAQLGKPLMWLDPSVMGTSFIQDVSVSINNNPVPTNSSLGPLFLQYNRLSKIFNHKAKVRITNDKQISATEPKATMSAVMKASTKAFDYGESYKATKGERIPVYMHGIFPFGCRNTTLESVDRQMAQSLYFPPDTTIDIKFHVRRDKMSAVFGSNLSFGDAYFNRDTVVPTPDDGVELEFQEATLEYESAEMTPEKETESLKLYAHGRPGYYEYDIPRGQHQALPADQSYTENTFQILPFARLVYLMFLQDWAVMPMDSSKRPLSGFSRFPPHCTGFRVDFAGEKGLLTDKFVNFGFTGDGKCQSEYSKKFFYDYLAERRMTTDKFEDFFPKEEQKALNQIFCFDLKNHESDKVEMLTLACEFAGSNKSPKNMQVPSVLNKKCIFIFE
jgi:hypothetical protein